VITSAIGSLANKKANESLKAERMNSSTTRMAKVEWDFSTCFACLSPLIGILVGFLSLFFFAR
jgi:hypothetical protein